MRRSKFSESQRLAILAEQDGAKASKKSVVNIKSAQLPCINGTITC